MMIQKDGRNTDTRQRIIKAAETLYLAGGYEKINFQEIANILHVSKPALFYHFASKQDLFFAVLLYMMDEMESLLKEAVPDEGISTPEQLRAMLMALLTKPAFNVMRFIHEEVQLLSYDQQRQIVKEVDTRMFAVVQRVFKVGIERGELREHDVRLSAILFLHMSMLRAHVTTHRVEPEKRKETINDNLAMFDLFLRGVLL